MKFRENIKIAVDNTQFYLSRGLQLTADNFCNFPILSKQVVAEQCASFKSLLPISIRPLNVSTSGSSGVPLQIQWNPVDYCSSLMEIWRIRKALGVLPSDRFVSAHVLFDNGKTVLTNKAIVHKNILSLSKIFFDEKTLLYYYQLISDFRPKWLLLPPSFLYGFLLFLEERNLSLPSSVVLVELTGEYCTKEVFDFFMRMYPYIHWRILYGMQEFNVIAYGSPDGLKILDENVYVEIITESGRAAASFQEGSIVVTGLKNSFTPLIRYRTEDYGYIDDLGALHITRARSNDQIKINGCIYDGSIFWMIVLKLKRARNIQILQFQVLLEDNHLSFFFKVDTPDKFDYNSTCSYIKEILACDFKLDYDVTIYLVDQIVPSFNGNKIKFFINKQS